MTQTFLPSSTSPPVSVTFTRTSVPPQLTNTFVPPSIPSNTPVPPPLPSDTPIPPSPTSSVCSPSYNADYENQVITLINNERAQKGLSSLSGQSQLAVAARVHSTDMACNDFMSHTGSDGSTMVSRIIAQGYSYSALGENVAAGYGSPAAVVAGWMSSQGHRDNILSPNFTQVGIGYAYRSGTSYGAYWTADFGSP